MLKEILIGLGIVVVLSIILTLIDVKWGMAKDMILVDKKTLK